MKSRPVPSLMVYQSIISIPCLEVDAFVTITKTNKLSKALTYLKPQNCGNPNAFAAAAFVNLWVWPSLANKKVISFFLIIFILMLILTPTLSESINVYQYSDYLGFRSFCQENLGTVPSFTSASFSGQNHHLQGVNGTPARDVTEARCQAAYEDGRYWRRLRREIDETWWR